LKYHHSVPFLTRLDFSFTIFTHDLEEIKLKTKTIPIFLKSWKVTKKKRKYIFSSKYLAKLLQNLCVLIEVIMEKNFLRQIPGEIRK
jgi:hypothetical protein